MSRLSVFATCAALAGCSGGPAYLVRGAKDPGTGARLEVNAGPLSSDLKVEQIDTMLRVPKDALTPELVDAFMRGVVETSSGARPPEAEEGIRGASPPP